ncbi:MAG: hypothetical protein JNK04_21655 [Myxococcales bacterium]|nr:hypothetical protein [Myxococcales bacterium]
MRAALLALVALTACGGKVVFVDDGGGGDGQGGQLTTSTGTTPLGTPCEKLCFGTPSCETKPGCLESCESNYTLGCEAEADAFYLCQFESFDPVTCAPSFCEAELDALHACQDGACSTSCDQDEFSCSCSQSCEFEILDVRCSLGPSGVECECQRNGAFVGTCGESALDCDPSAGCCAQIFAQE